MQPDVLLESEDAVAHFVSEAGAKFSNADADVVDTVHRLVRLLVSAVEFHS